MHLDLDLYVSRVGFVAVSCAMHLYWNRFSSSLNVSGRQLKDGDGQIASPPIYRRFTGKFTVHGINFIS